MILLAASHALAPVTRFEAPMARFEAPTTRRAALASVASLPLILAPMAATARTVPTECAREDLECVAARRAAAKDNIKENWGGIVGVGSLLVIRGYNRARVDEINPNSFNNVMRRKREEALKKKKRGGR